MGSKLAAKSIKSDDQIEPKMDCLLALIFNGFWWLLGGKLGWKIEPRAKKKSIEKRIEKNDETSMRFGGLCMGGGEAVRAPWLRVDPGTP